ncbi:MAG: DUF4974 domain-containing protein [Agriterribacter sp.]
MLHDDDESLLADESFINYCLGRNAQDVLRWKRFIEDHPGELNRIEDLKMMVLLTSSNVHEIELKNQIALLNEKIEFSEGLIEPTKSVPSINNNRRWWMIAAAACFVTICGLAWYFIDQHNASAPVSPVPTFATKPTQKKSFILPDGSTVILNAESSITLAPDFGQTSRRLTLTGEAFFDVTHDAAKPFIVETERMNVKVLGTAFNVKAYSTDAVYETSLLRGSVELSVKGESKTLMLHPNQKYVLANTTAQENKPSLKSQQRIATIEKTNEEGLQPLKIIRKDTSIVEVSWTENKLAFADEPLSEVAKKLERWYGVKIVITDPGIANTAYNGSFRNEDIINVLSALQFSKPFTFQKQNDEIIISK